MIELRVYDASPTEHLDAAPSPDRAPLNPGAEYVLRPDAGTAGAHVFMCVANTTDDSLYWAVISVGLDGTQPVAGIMRETTVAAAGAELNMNENGRPMLISGPGTDWLVVLSSVTEFRARDFLPPGLPHEAATSVDDLLNQISAGSGEIAVTTAAFSVAVPPLTLRALPAGCGDCLVVEYVAADGPHRILIDGGLDKRYEDGLGAYLDDAPGETVHFDLVVVTHVDRDHIDGIIRALGAGRLTTDDIWFNGRDEIDALINQTVRAVRQGDELSSLIPWDKRNRVVDGQAIVCNPEQPPVLALPGAVSCTILSPTVNRLERLLGKWPEPKDVVDPPAALLAELADDEEPAVRGVGDFGGDTSVANGSSIAFLLDVNGIRLLLTGDAFANDLEASITRLLAGTGETKLKVDLFKLSHHGSRRNMTDELLELIDPGAILVCTDGSRFRHPDHDALGKIREHYPTVPVHFTDDTDTVRDRAASIDCTPPTNPPLLLHFAR